MKVFSDIFSGLHFASLVFVTTQAEPRLGCEKISATTSSQETKKSPCKDELKARIMAAFTNLSKETIEKTCRRF